MRNTLRNGRARRAEKKSPKGLLIRNPQFYAELLTYFQNVLHQFGTRVGSWYCFRHHPTEAHQFKVLIYVIFCGRVVGSEEQFASLVVDYPQILIFIVTDEFHQFIHGGSVAVDNSVVLLLNACFELNHSIISFRLSLYLLYHRGRGLSTPANVKF